MRKVSVIGASGLIGSRLLRRLRRDFAGCVEASGTCLRQPAGPGLTRLDATDPAALEAHLLRDFDLVVVAAGEKDVRRCEEAPAHALAQNTRPVEEMLRIIARRGLRTRLCYLSTDYVFDGERGRYRPGDAPAPRTAYGRSKRAAELALLADPGGHRVVRSGAVLGRGALFFDWLLAELRAGREVRLFDDCFVSPTPVELLAEALAALVAGDAGPPDRVLHVVGERRASRYELGLLVASLLPGPCLPPVREARATGGPLFQADLSLVQSPWVRARQRRSLEEWLREEVAGG